MKQQVIVNGADNFVGRRVCAALAASDWAAPVAVATGDDKALRRSLAASQAIAHCVGGGARAIVHGAETLYGALAGTVHGPRVVHVSSMTVYGPATGRVYESASPLEQLGSYARAQLLVEFTARNYRNHVVLRPGAEYGPDCPHWSGQIARLLQAQRLGDLGAAGDGIANLVFIDDLVAAVLAALRQPDIEGEVFNVALADKPTWNEYFAAFARALGAVPVRRITHRRLELEARLLAPPLKATQLFARALRVPQSWLPPPLPPSLLRLCRQEIDLDVAKTGRLLGLRWTPLQRGLEQAASAYRKAASSQRAVTYTP